MTTWTKHESTGTEVLLTRRLSTEFVVAPDRSAAAVIDVDLSVGEGETVALVGESGSGKSVTALSVMGLLRRDMARVSGTAMFRGRDLLALTQQELSAIRGREISMVFQDPMSALNPLLTVGAQISAAIRRHLRLSKAGSIERAIDLLDEVGIPNPKSRVMAYPHELSGGMAQRVMIALALSCEPRMIIADEPTTALDVTIQAQILELLRQIQEDRRLSILIITHDLGVVAGMADYVNVMYAGRIVESGPAGSVFENPRHPYTAGLLDAVPRLDRPIGTSRAIRGRPAMAEEFGGCAFLPRCDYATESCQQTPVLSLDHSRLRAAACWHPLRADGDNRAVTEGVD